MGAESSDRLGNLSNGWKPLSHAESIKSIEQYYLSAICDIDQNKVAKYSKLYDVPHGFYDYKDLIKTVRPQVISIATRTNLKEEIIRYAIDYGVKGIYVEKPLATSINQCKRVLDLVAKFDVSLIYGTQRRGMHVFRRAKEMAYSGKLGRVKCINFEYGPGLLLWTLPHITDLITFLTECYRFANISAICEFDKKYTSDSDFIDSDPLVHTAIIEMNSGVKVSLTPGTGANTRIHLENGIISINSDGYSIDTFCENEFVGKFNELNRDLTPPSNSGTQELFSGLASSVLNSDNPNLVNSSEILGGTEILFGIVESGLRNGALVSYRDLRGNLEVTGRFGELYA